MFKMAKKPMYRLKNGPQNLQDRNTEGCSDFLEEILRLNLSRESLRREFHLNGSTLELERLSIWEMSKIFISSPIVPF